MQVVPRADTFGRWSRSRSPPIASAAVATNDKASPKKDPLFDAPAPPAMVVSGCVDPNRTTPYVEVPEPSSPKDAAPRAGFTIAGRYEVGAEIARGGMGAVYAAVDRAFDREVAVKLVREEYVRTDAARRFFVEARITGQLQHPGIPPIHEVGSLPDGRPYLVMKLIKGRTLSDLLQERETPGGELDRFLPIFEQICLAVAFAHARGVVHRDLKPQNIMVGAFGEVQVMDWGLAKRLADPEAGAERDVGASAGVAETRFGTVLGTLAYMPPEQARGETDRIDARSDVFGRGAILCAILTGTPPHTGAKSDALRRKIAAGDMTPALERVEHSPGPRLVNRLAMRCLAAEPAERPAHAGEVAASLRSITQFLETAVRKSEVDDATAAAYDKQRAARRRAGKFTWIGLVGLVLGLAVSGASLWHASNVDAAAREAIALRNKARLSMSRELFPVTLDGLAHDVNSGLFKRGEDRSGREASMQRVLRLVGDQEPQDQARAYLALAAAAAAIPEEPAVDQYWRNAAGRYKAIAPDDTEVHLACDAVQWPFPDPLRRTVASQARERLLAATHKGGLAESLRQQAADSLAAADKILKEK